MHYTDSRWLFTFLFYAPVEVFQQNYPRFWWLVYGVVKGQVWVLVGVAVYYAASRILASVIKYAKESAEGVKKQLTSLGKLIMLSGISVLVTLLLCEASLRLMFGVVPGTLVSSKNFKSVKELKDYTVFSTDAAGIMSVDTGIAAQIISLIQKGKTTGVWKHLYENYINDAGRLVDDVEEFLKPGFTCKLKKYMADKRQRTDDAERAIEYYVTHPINADGFRSIEFKPYNTEKKKILLLGDSYTWGHSATNFFKSFADNLLAEGYVVYNTGITCTDPVQYEQLAARYVPTLKPDVVIMNVYLGNDIQYYERKPLPYTPQMFTTNAGLLQNDFNGRMLQTPDSVYKVIRGYNCFDHRPDLVSRLCASTSIGTLIYRAFFRSAYPATQPPCCPTYLTYPKVNDNAKSVSNICVNNGCKLIVSVIPAINKRGNLTAVSDYKNLLKNIPYTLSPLGPEGYVSEEDGHFNDLGHEQYALFLHQQVQKILEK